MSQVTGGKFTYKRTVKTGDYESKVFEAEISFSVGEGESADDMARKVAHGVVAVTHEKLGLQAPTEPAPALSGGKAAIAAAEGTDPAAKPAGKRGPGRKQVADAAPAADPAAVEDPSFVAPVAGQKVQQKTDAPSVAPVPTADPAAVEDILTASEAPKEITDKDVSDAAAKKNGEIKNPQAIRSLVGKYVTFPKGTKDMTQEQRRAFMAELSALTAQSLAA